MNEKGQREMTFSECGEEIYKRLYHAKNEKEIRSFIEMILRNEDNRRDIRNSYVFNNYLPPLNKLGSENIYNYVVKLIS